MSQLEIEQKFITDRTKARVINGAFAGAVGVTCTFPVDLVKTRLQNQLPVNGRMLYNNMFDCFGKSFVSEGFFGMYRGFAVNFFLIMPEKAIKLTMNDVFRHWMSHGGKLTYFQESAAGAGAGMCQAIITAPMEMFKIYGQDAGRVAAQHHAVNGSKATLMIETNSVLSVTKEIFLTKGFVGFYKGFGATLLRDIPFSIIYFPLYSRLNAIGLQKRDAIRSPFYISLTSGIIAGGIAAMAVNPFDVVKTRLQKLTQDINQRPYGGVIDCAKRLYNEEGFRTFFRGALPRAIVIAPLFGIAQTVYSIGIGEHVLGIKQTRPV